MSEIKRLKLRLSLVIITIFVLSVSCVVQAGRISKMEQILIQQAQINENFIEIIETMR